MGRWIQSAARKVIGLRKGGGWNRGNRIAVPLRLVTCFLVVMLSIFLSANSARASISNVYYAATAQGSNSGADCADAYAVGDPAYGFNVAANWGSGSNQIGPGTTVHLCGTFNGTAGQTLLTFQASGSSGNPITLLFEPGADLTAPYWGGNGHGAIDVSGKSYITIDGGTNGIIQNTQDGTGLTYHAVSFGIYLNGVSNVTVQNLSIINICQVTSASDTTGCDNGISSTGIWVTGGASNVTIQHNLIHDVTVGFYYGSSGTSDSNDNFQYNTVYRVWNSVQEYGSGSTQGFNLIGNDFYCVTGGTCNFADNGCTRHVENVHFYLGSGATYTGTIIADNYFHDTTGCLTGNLNLEDASHAGALKNLKIFNNIFSSLANWGQSDETAGNLTVNNTYVGTGPSGSVVAIAYIGTPLTIENNLITSVSAPLSFRDENSGNTINYNSYYNWNSGAGWEANSAHYSTLASWQAGSSAECSGGCDLNSITANPNLNADFTLPAGSPAIGAGANLTNLGITLLDQGAPQFFGVNYACGTGCVQRPSSGPWDIGAYEYSGQASSQPAAPTGLIASIQ